MMRFFEKYKRGIAFFLLLSILEGTVMPTAALALTSGPAQPESSSFTPAETSDMVNLFTGDLNYNIPLLDVGGYPINISYNGGSFMDQEASWVGLGWNINVGSVTRNMRGLPDDYNGDLVKKETNMKPNETYGVTLGVGGEFFGIDGLSLSYSQGLSYNNYTGYGFCQSIGLSVIPSEGFPGTIGLGLSASEDGMTVSPKITFVTRLLKNEKEKAAICGDLSFGTSYNSRAGLKGLTVGAEIYGSTNYDKSKTAVRNNHGPNIYSQTTEYDFGAATYVPQLSMPMHNKSYLFSLSAGGTVLGLDLTANIGGSYSKQSLEYNSKDIPAYGYMYQENGQDLGEVLLDFNREKDGPFSENSVILPVTNNTYDVYSVAGQGVGGSYRLCRSDVGYLFDSYVPATSENNSGSGDLSFGNSVQVGINYYDTKVDQWSGKWSENNPMTNFLRFKGREAGKPYEPAYFKEAGELTFDESNLYNQMLGDISTRLKIGDAGYDTWVMGTLVGSHNEEGIVQPDNRRPRAKRNQLLSYLTKKEYAGVALNANLSSAIPSSVPAHHVAEISTTKTDGTRYVYGLPVFNTKHIERSFNVSGSTVTNELVTYTSGTDDSNDNKKGIDNFYTSSELPPYAYSYLLTAVLSNDYVDVTGNGPTDDDLGNYTKFEYGTSNTGAINTTCSSANNSALTNYNWRTPYSVGALASYNDGLKTVPDDDQGSYMYGEKQITYLKQITTKNYVAVFNLRDRKDGKGVISSGGGIGAAQKLLESIQLFSKPDFIANGATGAFVIKQVNFVYDYLLCPSVPNNSGGFTSPYETANQGGKLTLNKIYFTYGKSKKAYFSPYQFTYNTQAYNASNTLFIPGYDLRGYDRWGTYKPAGLSGMPNSEYPYTEQDKMKVDSYARLWNLKTVTLPSGGIITIDLESDDYAYVQNKRAAQMFKVVGASSAIPSSYQNVSLNTLSSQLYAGGTDNSVFYFKLSELIDFSTIGITAATTKFRNEYLSRIENLYFRFYTKVNNSSTNGGYEYVSGYGEIMNSGILNSSSMTPSTLADYGWVQLKTVSRGDRNGGAFQESAVAKAGWQFARMHTPRSVFSSTGQPPSPNGGITDFIRAVADADFFKNTVDFFRGMYGTMKSNGHSQNFVTNKSWIRLNNPKRNKLGGGNRVSRITMSDEWATMISGVATNANKTFSYGQTYEYTTTDPETDYKISSGVATNEPQFGADENGNRFPIYNSSKKEEILLAPDNDLYKEGPYGESFYPSASVGYSEITVKNLYRPSVLINSTGKTVHNFYTARDFPVTTKLPTDLYVIRQKSNPLQKFLQMDFKDHLTASQGLCVELNDMHGKQRGTYVYDAKENRISGITYYYNTSGGAINNEIPVMKKDGSILKATLGMDFDMVADFRQQETTTDISGLQGNSYLMMLGSFPFFVPPIIPSHHKEEVRFRSAVLTKVIKRFGILKKTIVEDMSSKSETNNLVWDGLTGQVLLTSTNTEFKESLYNFSYPAHYAYSGMGPACKNAGMEFDLSTLASNITGPTLGKVNAAYISYLEPGDELVVIDKTTGSPVSSGSGNTNDSKCWVKKQGNDLFLIDKNGAILFQNSAISGTNYLLRVVRSGCRNMQDVNVGTVTTFNSPVDLSLSNTTWPLLDASKNVLNASAVEYGNSWRTFCSCGLATTGVASNGYLNGTVGIYRPKKSYTYLTMRKQTNLNDNTNIRKDGVFEKFDPFWIPNVGGDWIKPNDLNSASPKWTWASEVTEFSPYGMELENRDALGRYSGAIYGYNNNLPIAVGANTKYKQMAFDGFEDYNFNTCYLDGHFNFKNAVQIPFTYMSGDINNQKFAHSGRKAMKVASGQTSVVVVKDLKPCQ